MKKRLRKIVLLFITTLLTLPACAAVSDSDALPETPETAVADTAEEVEGQMDWEPVMNAIIQVESQGNPKARHGSSVGAMQITPILVAECNNILKARKSKKRYKLRDRLSIQKSKEMFLLFQSKYNPLNNIEKAIRSWNGGIHYGIKQTQRYYEKVMGLLH